MNEILMQTFSKPQPLLEESCDVAVKETHVKELIQNEIKRLQ